MCAIIINEKGGHKFEREQEWVYRNFQRKGLKNLCNYIIIKNLKNNKKKGMKLGWVSIWRYIGRVAGVQRGRYDHINCIHAWNSQQQRKVLK